MTKASRAQRGTFTWEQARDEYTVAEIRTHIRRGAWIRVFRGVYRESSTPASTTLSLSAARLSMAVDRIVACRHTAAQLHGFAVLNDPAVHVLSPVRRNTRTPGLIVHRDVLATQDLVTLPGAQASSPVRTALDLARTYSRLDALAALDLALRRNLLSGSRFGVRREELEHGLTSCRGLRGCRQAVELVGLADPLAESAMESRTRLRCIDAGLPQPVSQVVVQHNGIERRLDLAWPQWRIGLDYDSTEWHSGSTALARDNPRHNWLMEQGWQMFYATAVQVYRTPEQFTEPIRRAIHRASS